MHTYMPYMPYMPNMPYMPYIHTIHTHTYITLHYNPPWNFLFRIATVKPRKMVLFRALLFLGYLPSVNDSNFIEDPGDSDFVMFYRDFKLKTILSTSKLRVLGPSIL